jgi:hypothetical protein
MEKCVDDMSGESKKPTNGMTKSGPPQIKSEEQEVFRRALRALEECSADFLIGGAFAKYFFTGLWRFTKDMDVFIKPSDLKLVLEVLAEAGFETEVTNPKWLAKATEGDYLIDIIFGSGNGLIQVDDSFFDGAIETDLFGFQVPIMPVEEVIAMASHVASRDRFDASDIAHLILQKEGLVDWGRVLNRLGGDRLLLLWHLLFFDYVYPGHPEYLPQELMSEIFEEMKKRWSDPPVNKKYSRGTLLDSQAFAVDVCEWGYEDPRPAQPLVDEEGNFMKGNKN